MHTVSQAYALASARCRDRTEATSLCKRVWYETGSLSSLAEFRRVAASRYGDSRLRVTRLGWTEYKSLLKQEEAEFLKWSTEEKRKEEEYADSLFA